MNSFGSTTFSILIPCHNEEQTIASCVNSCLCQIRPADQIIVVDDGSTDNSAAILETFGNKIDLIKLAKNTGNKSYVQQIGLKSVRGDVFIATDADSLLDKDFIKCIEKDFQDPNTQAVAGYVVSTRHNWLTALREIEYIVGQEINKTAQANIGFLFVIPGCASAFRTEAFNRTIAFDHDTLTEDLDFTYKFNRSSYRIFFEKKAITYTQDPADFKSYVGQVRRWYTGGWQNLVKHASIIKQRPASAFELSLMYVEGLSFSSILYLLPIINIRSYLVLMGFYAVAMVILGAYASIVRRRLDLLFYSPLYIIIAYVNSYVFIEQFIKVVLFREKKLDWFSPERHA